MKVRLLVLALAAFAAGSARADLVADVRALIAAKDFAGGEAKIAEYRKSQGTTPEMILALSWLGRGAQANKMWEEAARYAEETRVLSLDALKSRELDAEPKLPLALGASIEVQGHTMAARGARTEAVSFLDQELKRWYATSIRTRIQKNIHLLSLEGKKAPELQLKEWIGSGRTPELASLKGKPLLLFFWAHWCGDCKYQGPILSRLQQEFGSKGLTVIGPTQRYGYVAGGADAKPADEAAYIDKVRGQFYGDLSMAVPLSEDNFKNFGCSTTPTLVLVDRKGSVALYHPGKMSYEQLLPHVSKVTSGS